MKRLPDIEARPRPHHAACAAALLLMLLVGCSSIVRNPERVDTFTLPPPTRGVLAEFGATVDRRLEDGQSGLLLLPENAEALRWRLALIDEARVSIDLQSFLWADDYSGSLMMERLLLAADRGVRVRLLVDDIFLRLPDRTVAALSSHPYVEVRIFNPNPARRTSAGSVARFLIDLNRLNRRMHNKLFVADGHVAIVGGRNIGDAYFGLSRRYNFRDLDVVVTGPVVDSMNGSFDAYWNSPYAHPGQAIHPRAGFRDLQRLREHLTGKIANASHLEPWFTHPPSWRRLLLRSAPSVIPADARFVYDHPYERLNRSVVASLEALLGPETTDVFIVTPYFIPDGDMFEILANLTERGIEIQLLVPSLASINHTVVHGHYGRHRDSVVEQNVRLFEYRHDPRGNARRYADTSPVRSAFVSMHMKAVVSGDNLAYVGSLNFDPRAIRINTENGLIIESKEFVRELRAVLEPMTSEKEAWRVTLNPNGTLWSAGDETVTRAPARSSMQRFSSFLFGLLPIADQL